MKGILFCVACLFTLTACIGQNQSKDQSDYTIDVNQFDRFNLYNRWGAVTVKAISGNKAKMSVTRRLKADNKSKLEQAKKEIYLDSMISNGQIYFFIQHPDLEFSFKHGGGLNYRGRNKNWWNEEEKIEYEFTIVLEIPANEPLTVVNHSEALRVSGMQADLIAANHHDDVLVKDQGGSADVHSHHGAVEVFYTKNPTRDCDYGTHHGDIKVHYQSGLSVDASLYSYHGEFYSGFDWKMKPIQLSQSDDKKGRYKVKNKKGTAVQIGNGGQMQQFRTHHGDIYLLNTQSN